MSQTNSTDLSNDKVQVQSEASSPVINRPFTDGVAFDKMKTGSGVYYIPYRNPADKEVYFKEYSIAKHNPSKENLNSLKGSGPTTFLELAVFLFRTTKNPAAPPPILFKKIGRMFDDQTGYWVADDSGTNYTPHPKDPDPRKDAWNGPYGSWGTSVVTDVPQGYICVGDTYHFGGNQSNNQLIMYAHHSICFTGTDPWLRKEIKGNHTLSFWDIKYDQLSDEIRALYTNPYINLIVRPFPVMILRTFFQYSSENQLFFEDNQLGHFYITTAIKGLSGILDVHNNVRLDNWLYNGPGPHTGSVKDQLRMAVVITMGDSEIDRFPGIENDTNRKYLQLDYNEALDNISGAIADPHKDIDHTTFLGLSKDGNLQIKFIGLFVNSLSSEKSNDTKKGITSTPATIPSNNVAPDIVGAIVGGIVGGLLGLGVIVLIIFWIRNRSRQPPPVSQNK